MPRAKTLCSCGNLKEAKSALCAACWKKSQAGSGNYNWQGGISKERYRYKKIQIARYPEKNAARRAVYYALKQGRLVRGACEICGAERTEAHHENYSQPLAVRWLCKPHHCIVDQQKRGMQQ